MCRALPGYGELGLEMRDLRLQIGDVLLLMPAHRARCIGLLC